MAEVEQDTEPKVAVSVGQLVANLANMTKVTTALIILLNIVGTVGIVLVNKSVFATYAFRFPVMLMCFHHVTIFLCTRAMVAAGTLDCGVDLPLRHKLGPVLGDVIALTGLNYSLMVNTVGTFQTLKFLTIPAICVLEYMKYSKSYSPVLLTSIAVLVFGVATATVNEVGFSAVGTFWGVVGAIGAALNQVLTKEAKEHGDLSTFQMMYRLSPFSAPALFACAFLTGDIQNGFLQYEYTPAAAGCILGSCALAIFVVWSVVACVSCTSPITFQVVGLAKTVLTFVFGMLMFDSNIQAKSLAGVVIATCGFAWYVYLKTAPPKQKEVEEVIEQPQMVVGARRV